MVTNCRTRALPVDWLSAGCGAAGFGPSGPVRTCSRSHSSSASRMALSPRSPPPVIPVRHALPWEARGDRSTDRVTPKLLRHAALRSDERDAYRQCADGAPSVTGDCGYRTRVRASIRAILPISGDARNTRNRSGNRDQRGRRTGAAAHPAPGPRGCYGSIPKRWPGGQPTGGSGPSAPRKGTAVSGRRRSWLCSPRGPRLPRPRPPDPRPPPRNPSRPRRPPRRSISNTTESGHRVLSHRGRRGDRSGTSPRRAARLPPPVVEHPTLAMCRAQTSVFDQASVECQDGAALFRRFTPWRQPAENVAETLHHRRPGRSNGVAQRHRGTRSLGQAQAGRFARGLPLAIAVGSGPRPCSANHR